MWWQPSCGASFIAPYPCTGMATWRGAGRYRTFTRAALEYVIHVPHYCYVSAVDAQPVGFWDCLQVMVVDFDVHHGNGTMDAFYDDPSVLYVSTHQAGLWPYTGKARDAGGRGPGAGCTVNIPLPGGAGDEAMRQVGGSCWKGANAGQGRR